MWYIYFRGDSWEQGVGIADGQEAEEIVAESNGELACQYIA